jgi:hypothetical protein
VTTAKDQIRLDEIATAVDRCLPKTADLDKDMKDKMDSAYTKLNDIIREQNRLIASGKSVRKI